MFVDILVLEYKSVKQSGRNASISKWAESSAHRYSDDKDLVQFLT